MANPIERVPRWKLPRRDDGVWDAHARAALLEHALDGLVESVIVTEADGRIVFSNRTAPGLLGPMRAGAGLCDWFASAGLESLDDDDSPCAAEHALLGRVLGGAEVPEEVWYLRARGEREPRHVAIVAHPLRGDDDAVEGAIVVLRDVTARTRATESLERLSRAVEQTADMIVIADRKGAILYVNAAFTTMTGYAPAEAIGKTPSLLRSGEHSPAEFADLWATILRGEVWRGTLVNRRKDGSTYPSEQTITPVRNRNGRITHFVAVSKDMTVRNRLREREVESQLAATVQRRLYPGESPAVPGLDVAGAVFSAEATCGDYYDWLVRPDGRLAVVVGDVSGHGMPAAILMAETRAYLRSLVTTPIAADEILARIHALLRQDLTEGGFVTLLLAEIEPATGRLRYANAGHLPGIRIRADGSEGERLDPTGPALGIQETPVYRLRDAAPLEPGELLLLLTDGAVEAPGATGEPIDEEVVIREAARLAHLPAAHVVRQLYETIERLSGARSSRDDVTLLAVKATGPFVGPHPTSTTTGA